jgi:hypothetical protein
MKTRKIWAMVGALLTGTLGVAIVDSLPQQAHAAFFMN